MQGWGEPVAQCMRGWEGMDSRIKRGTRHPIITRGALEKVRAGRFVVLVQRDERTVAC